nr:glycosyltransferase family 4 protein [Candidatus Woesebacteria bacterium]
YKVLEAMASGTPIVATTTAVEGLEVVNGTHVMTSNTPEGMAGLAIELLNNEEKRKKMAVNGKKFVKDQYDWSLISHKLDAIYQRIGSK